jgi:hypothetical protein
MRLAPAMRMLLRMVDLWLATEPPLFADRREAGRLLAELLDGERGQARSSSA